MEWKEPREKLKLRAVPLSKSLPKIDAKLRAELLVKYNYTCCYCGGYYKKYLTKTVVNLKTDDIDTCCKACYLLTHLSGGLYHEMDVYYSQLSQLDIVRKTVNHIIKNKIVPSPLDIDKNIKKISLSVLEFINIVNNYQKAPFELRNYKIFFSPDLPTDFIIANLESGYTFTNDSDNEDDEDNIDYNLDISMLDPKTDPDAIKFIDKYFTQ